MRGRERQSKKRIKGKRDRGRDGEAGDGEAAGRQGEEETARQGVHVRVCVGFGAVTGKSQSLPPIPKLGQDIEEF